MVLVLSGRRHPVARAWALAAGAAAILIAFSVLGLTLLQNLHARHHRSPADATIDLAAGVLLTLLAARALHPRKTAAESHHNRTQRRLADTPTILFVGVGGHSRQITVAIEVLFAVVLIWKGIAELS